MGLPRARRPVVSGAFAIMESQMRVRKSAMSAENDRRQGFELTNVNRALDREMDGLFDSLVLKRAQLKVESQALYRISSDGKRTEPIDVAFTPPEPDARLVAGD